MAEENAFQEQDEYDIPDFPEEQGQEEEEQMPMRQQMPMQQPPLQQQPPRMPQRPRMPPRRPARPAPVQMTPQMAAAQAAPMPQQMLPQQQAIQQASQPTQAPARFIPYEIPRKVGFYDRSTNRPIIEDEDKTPVSVESMLRVLIAAVADLKNDMEELKAQFNTA